MSKYLGLFVTEATEHLEALGRELVRLEKTPDQAQVDALFRHAHSVKGMAASMGFEGVATLAHRVEDLVEAVREDLSRLDRPLVDLLLASADAMMAQVREVEAGKAPADAPELIASLGERLRAFTGRAPTATRVNQAQAFASPGPTQGAPPGGRPPEVDPPLPGDATVATAQVPAAEGPGAREAVRAAPAAGAAADAPPPVTSGEPRLGAPTQLSLSFQVAPSCQVPGVRAFLVYRKLTGLGRVLELRPPLEDLKAGRLPEGRFEVDLETPGSEGELREALAKVAEVELVSLAPGRARRAAPVAVAPPPPAADVIAAGESARTVRVRTELLDYFLDTVGELLLATSHLRALGKALPEANQPPVEEGVDRLHALVKDLHDKVMSARMTPVSVVTDRLPRAARDLARRTGREVELELSNTTVELDRAILDELGDPLLHLLRNCIDHGIETPEERVAAGKPVQGRVSLSVQRERDRVVLQLEDDGRGMSAEKLKRSAVARGALTPEAAARLGEAEALLLCCLPGVSTARDVTDISGRGVGMDAVKRTVEGVGGTLEITSVPGRGTRFTLRLPLTVAVVQLLLVGVGEEIYGLPIAKVLGAVEADPARLSTSRERPLLPHGDGLLPVHSLGELLQIPETPCSGARPFVLMESDTGRVALAVERLLGQEEVVLKPLTRPLDLVPGLSGSTILGTGRPIFILDVSRLLSA